MSELHRRSGAQLGVWFGCELPDRFSDWQTEYHYLRESVGLIDKNYRAYLEFTGPDRARYLNAILTNDIKGLQPNHGTVSLFLNPQGHIQAELETYALGEQLLCVSYAMIREHLIPAMDKYIIMDDVTLTDRTDAFSTLALEGPKSAALTAEVTGIQVSTLDELETREATVGQIPCRVSKRSPGEIPSAEFLVSRAHTEDLWQLLLPSVLKAGGGPVGYLALNTLRLELGIPWFSYDFGEKQIPHEAGLQVSHISYTKGCYTGQEIVERVRSRGQVNRVRVSLQLDTRNPPTANTPLLVGGKEAGYVTRSGFSPLLNSFIGMGYVRREKAVIGSELELAEGKATVIATPLISKT